jgi:hypothetical protein
MYSSALTTHHITPFHSRALLSDNITMFISLVVVVIVIVVVGRLFFHQLDWTGMDYPANHTPYQRTTILTVTNSANHTPLSLPYQLINLFFGQALARS